MSLVEVVFAVLFDLFAASLAVLGATAIGSVSVFIVLYVYDVVKGWRNER